MLKYTASILLLMFISIAASAQSTEDSKKSEIEVVACEVKLKAATANFYFTYGFIAETDVNGVVSKIEQISGKRNPPFIKDEDLVNCIQSWKLLPNEKYSVAFGLGTNGSMVSKNNNYILISNKKESIKIVLSSVFSDLEIK